MEVIIIIMIIIIIIVIIIIIIIIIIIVIIMSLFLEDYILSTNMNLSNIWSSVKLNKKEHIYSTCQTISTNKR